MRTNRGHSYRQAPQSSIRCLGKMAVCLLGSLTILLCLQELAEAQSSAPQALEEANLSPFRKYWITAEEVQLRNRLNALIRLERKLNISHERFRTFVEKQKRYRQRIAEYRKLYQRNQLLLGRNSTTPQQRQQLQNESELVLENIEKWEREYQEQLNAEDEVSPITRSAVQVINLRNSITITVMETIRTARSLEASYKQLEKQEPIQRALKDLGDSHQLGPVEDYVPTLKRKLVRLKSTVFTNGAPIYRRSGNYRLSLILNERAPATFSYMGLAGDMLLTQSMLQLSGIEVPENAPTVTVEKNGRKIVGQKINIPTLRIGGLVFNRVEAVVLPAEAEDIGGFVSDASFRGMNIDLDAENMWFRLTQ